jgi:hypothetical protein
MEKGGRHCSESDGVAAPGGGSHACLRRNCAMTRSWKRLSEGWGGESGSPTLPSLRFGSPTSEHLALGQIHDAANGTDDTVDLIDRRRWTSTSRAAQGSGGQGRWWTSSRRKGRGVGDGSLREWPCGSDTCVTLERAGTTCRVLMRGSRRRGDMQTSGEEGDVISRTRERP